MRLHSQFHRQNKIYDFISFTNTRSRASHSNFFEFLNNNFFLNIKKIGKMLHFFVCIVFILLERDRKRKITNVTVYAIQYPTK